MGVILNPALRSWGVGTRRERQVQEINNWMFPRRKADLKYDSL